MSMSQNSRHKLSESQSFTQDEKSTASDVAPDENHFDQRVHQRGAPGARTSTCRFLLLFDKVSGSANVHYHMVDPASGQKIYPKENTFAARQIKDACGYKPIVFGGRLYIIGGRDWNTGVVSARVSRYDPHLNEWQEVKGLQRARSKCTAEVLGGFLYVMGGLVTGIKVTDSVERYNPGTNEWVEVAPLPSPRVDHASCVLNNVIYVSGGTNSPEYPGTNTFWCYEPVENTWKDVENGNTYLPYERSSHVMCPLDDKRIIILGGQVFDQDAYCETDEPDIYEYNVPEAHVTTDVRTTWYMDHPRMSVPRANSCIVLIGTNIWVIGGFSYNKKVPIKAAAYYDTVRKRWRDAFQLPDHHYDNMDGVLMDVPNSNTNFVFSDRFIYSHWVMW